MRSVCEHLWTFPHVRSSLGPPHLVLFLLYKSWELSTFCPFLLTQCSQISCLFQIVIATVCQTLPGELSQNHPHLTFITTLYINPFVAEEAEAQRTGVTSVQYPMVSKWEPGVQPLRDFQGSPASLLHGLKELCTCVRSLFLTQESK